MLWDPGASANFVNERVASKLEIPIHRVSEVRVSAFNEQFVCERAILPKVTMNGTTNDVLFYVMRDGCTTDVEWLLVRDGMDKLGIWSKTVEFIKTLTHSITHESTEFSHEVAINDTFTERLLEAQLDVPRTRYINSAGKADVYFADTWSDVQKKQMLEARTANKLSDTEVRKFGGLLNKFKDIFAQDEYDMGCVEGDDNDFRIEIKDGIDPIYCKAKSQSPKNRAEIQRIIDQWMKAGIIRMSTSPWAAPVTLVSKANGDPRLCVNYIRMNKVTTEMKFPLPTVDDVSSFVQGAKWLTTVDMCWAYQHLKVRETDIPKTAFVTEDGHYELTRMIFGFSGAPAWFQSRMRRILWSLRDIVMVYIDDIY
jgi:hypothetical protein